MQIKVLEASKNKLKFTIVGQRYTIPEMLKKQLLTNKDVVMASGMLKHPEDPDCEFVLTVKPEADAKKILLEAIEELQAVVKSFKIEMLKECPNSSLGKKKQEKEKKSKK